MRRGEETLRRDGGDYDNMMPSCDGLLFCIETRIYRNKYYI